MQLFFKNKPVTDWPSEKSIVALKTYTDLKTAFKNKSIIPDSINGIYAIAGNGTFFKTVTPPEVAPQSWTGGMSYFSLFGNSYPDKTAFEFLKSIGYKDAKLGTFGGISLGNNSASSINLKVYKNDKAVCIPLLLQKSPSASSESIKAELLGAGLNQTDAEVLSKGAGLINYRYESDSSTGEYRIVFAGTIYDSTLSWKFVVDNKVVDWNKEWLLTGSYFNKKNVKSLSGYPSKSTDNNSRCDLNAIFQKTSVSSYTHGTYYTYSQKVPVTVAIVINGKYVYIPTKTLDSGEWTENMPFYGAPIESVRSKLVSIGINDEMARVIARGIIIRQTSKTSKTIDVYFAEEMTIPSNINTSYIYDDNAIRFKLCFGDYYYLSKNQ